MHDVIVAGGGPAGLAVAIGAAQAGLDVVLCERRTGTIDKACGEGLMPGAVTALAALGIDPPGRSIGGITYRQRDSVARAAFTNGLGRGVRRTVLHDSLRAAVSDAGVTVLAQHITDIRQDADHVVAGDLSARYLVAADGLHSPIRNQLGLSAPTILANRWGQRRHFRVEPASDFVEVTWAQHSEAYVTPVSEDTIGVAILSSVRAPFDEQLGAFPALSAQLRGAEPTSDVRGAGPLRQRVRGRVKGRVLLVGDAAGYIDALTGEGIAISLSTATELVSCLLDDDPERYERAWLRTSRSSRLITSGLLWARRRPVLARSIVPLAARFPPLFSVAVNQLAG
jgi:flavin-dependent dehydrogenase